MGVSRVHRLLRLITLLQSGRPRTAADLMLELEVSRRTLFRDLSMLQMAGVPYYHEPGQGYRISRSFFLPPISLTVMETLGLMMLGKTAIGQRGRPLVGSALSGIYKLLSTVPEPIRSACGEMMANVSVDPGAQLASDNEAQHYALLQQCIDEGRACELIYQSPVEDEPLRCELEPHGLHHAARAWYVMGRTDAHDQVRVLKLARIESLEPTDRRFRKPKRFVPADKLGSAWQLIPEGKQYDVELVFTKKVATNVSEVRWHPSQQHEMLKDGRCVMRFRVDGIGEIAWWLCGYADQVVVRKPNELRQRVCSMLEAALANYQ